MWQLSTCVCRVSSGRTSPAHCCHVVRTQKLAGVFSDIPGFTVRSPSPDIGRKVLWETLVNKVLTCVVAETALLSVWQFACQATRGSS
jgi:hypothetical protein